MHSAKRNNEVQDRKQKKKELRMTSEASLKPALYRTAQWPACMQTVINSVVSKAVNDFILPAAKEIDTLTAWLLGGDVGQRVYLVRKTNKPRVDLTVPSDVRFNPWRYEHRG